MEEGNKDWVEGYFRKGFRHARELNVGLLDQFVTIASGSKRAEAPSLIYGKLHSLEVSPKGRLRVDIKTVEGVIMRITAWRTQTRMALLWKQGG